MTDHRVSAAPGVVSASTASYLPLETTNLTVGINIPGTVPPRRAEGFVVQAIDVGPAWFTTVGNSVVRGREFDLHDDRGAPDVAIVNQALADRFWPGDIVVGRLFSVGTEQEKRDYQIVGVVPTGKYRTLGERPRPVLSRPLLQHYQPRTVVLVHYRRRLRRH